VELGSRRPRGSSTAQEQECGAASRRRSRSAGAPLREDPRSPSPSRRRSLSRGRAVDLRRPASLLLRLTELATRRAGARRQVGVDFGPVELELGTAGLPPPTDGARDEARRGTAASSGPWISSSGWPPSSGRGSSRRGAQEHGGRRASISGLLLAAPSAVSFSSLPFRAPREGVVVGGRRRRRRYRSSRPTLDLASRQANGTIPSVLQTPAAGK
jgi:hypothetical protein